MQPSTEIQGILNAFSEPAILLGRDYTILAANTAYRDVYGFAPEAEAMPRCYRVSHGYTVPCDQAGESCPLRASLASGSTSRVLHIHHTPRGDEYVNVEMLPIKDPATGEILFFIERMHPSAAGSAQSDGEPLVGRAASFRQMLALVERVARSDANVMLLGETGTGKEIVAETIHRLSDRRSRAFVPVECSGLPESLFESELFGYVKGAFTGATANRTGLIEAADGGTLFLDEVGDVPLPEQVKLLRLLETRRYRPVGSNEWKQSDFRLVCATNRDLQAMVAAGEFRADLYFRLNVFEITLPALRDRIEDLELLIQAILLRLGQPEIRFSPAALDCLRRYPFPGNIRELRNIVERATLLANAKQVGVDELPPHVQGAPSRSAAGTGSLAAEIVPLEVALDQYLQHALAVHKGDRKSLAQALGISERALYRKLAAARAG